MDTDFCLDGSHEGDPNFLSGEIGDFCGCAERQADGNWLWQLDRWEARTGRFRPVSQGVAESEGTAEAAIRAAIAKRQTVK